MKVWLTFVIAFLSLFGYLEEAALAERELPIVGVIPPMSEFWRWIGVRRADPDDPFARRIWCRTVVGLWVGFWVWLTIHLLKKLERRVAA